MGLGDLFGVEMDPLSKNIEHVSDETSSGGWCRDAMGGGKAIEEEKEQQEKDAEPLGGGEWSPETAVEVAAKEFEKEASEGISEGEGPDEEAGTMRFAREVEQKKEERKFEKGVVELPGMERNAEGSAAELRGGGIMEGDAPGQGGWFAKVAAGGETAEPADGDAEGKCRRADVAQKPSGNAEAQGEGQNDERGSEKTEEKSSPTL